MTETHSHEHIHTPDQSELSPAWVAVTSGGNTAIGGLETASGLGYLGTKAQTLSLVAEGVHSFLGDSLAFMLQGINVICKLPEKRKQQLRKVTFWVMAASSVSVGVKAGVDIGIGHESEPENNVGLYSGIGSLAFSGMMYGLYRRKISSNKQERTVYEQDILDHFHHIDFPFATLAAFGAAIQHASPLAEQAAAIASAAWGTYKFRPTEKNMNSHNCPAHSEAEHIHEHEHSHASRPSAGQRLTRTLRRLVPKTKTEATPVKKSRKWRLAAGIGSACLAITGLLSSSTATEKPSPRHNAAAPVFPQYTQNDTPKMHPGNDLPPKHKANPEPCKTIMPGDSQWSITQNYIKHISSHDVSDSTVAHITQLTTALNKSKFSDPDMITPGTCLTLPSAKTVQAFVAA